MSLNIFKRVSLALWKKPLGLRCYTTNNTVETTTVDLSKVSDEPLSLDDVEEIEKIEKKRNKSRLNPQDRKILFGKQPYDEPQAWYHSTVRYKKRMLGRYGLSALDVTPGVLWPTQAEVADAKEYEKVAYPRTIQKEMEVIKMNEQRRKETIEKREAELALKAAKNEEWIQKLHDKIAEKQRLIQQAKERRAKIIDEIRRETQVSFVDLFDPKMKQLFAEKDKLLKKQEKDEKKKSKEEKKRLKEEKKQKRAEQLAAAQEETGNALNPTESDTNTIKNEETDK